MRSSARDWSLDRGRRRSGASKRRLPQSARASWIALSDAQFSNEEQMISLWHARRGASNAGAYLGTRISRASPRLPCPGARRRRRLRTDCRSASFVPQQGDEFAMDTRRLPADAGGDTVETAQMRRPEWQLRQGSDVVQLSLE